MTLLEMSTQKVRKTKVRKGHVVTYIRWSDESQTISEAAQRKELASYAEKMGLTIEAEFAENVSGAAELRKRPGLLNALDAVKSLRCEGLLVLRIDRLCRSADLTGAISQHLTQQGQRIITADGTSEDQSTFAVVVRQLQAGMAQIERSLIAARTSSALASLKAQGKRHTRIPPYGYAFENGKAVEHAQEQIVIATVKQLAGEGKGATEVARILSGKGIVNRNGRVFSPVTMYQLMKKIGVL